MTNIKIWEWLEKQGYQIEYGEYGEYKMYYASDMPKILNAFCEYQKQWRKNETRRKGRGK